MANEFADASLFDNLSGDAGVFLFPDLDALPADQVSELEITKRRLNFLSELTLDSKFEGSDSFKVSDALRWISEFQRKIEMELLKLKMLLPPPEHDVRTTLTKTNAPINASAH